MHRVFHGIRFKVNEDWVSAIDTLLFFYTLKSRKSETKVDKGKIKGRCLCISLCSYNFIFKIFAPYPTNKIGVSWSGAIVSVSVLPVSKSFAL